MGIRSEILSASARKMVMPAKKEYLNDARLFLVSFLKDTKTESRASADMQLALVEWCENIIKYGYNGGKGEIGIKAEVKPKVIKVTVTDSGIAFDPLKYEPPDTMKRIMAGIGGRLGIKSIREICDKFEYRRAGGKNRVVFVKKIKSA